MQVNPNVFFKFHDGKFVVWNYRAHEQFELTLPYLQRLHAIGTAESQEPPAAAPEPAQIDAELPVPDSKTEDRDSAGYVRPQTSFRNQGGSSSGSVLHVLLDVLLVI